MKLTVHPPLSQWSVAPPARPRQDLAAIVNANADRLGTGRISGAKPLVATGHQAFFWHPGILAKDIATRVAADRLGVDALHVVVDQDVHDATTIDVPHVRNDHIVVDRVKLAEQRVGVPTGTHEPMMFRPEHPHLPAAVIESLSDLPACASLAEQVTVVLSRLRRPFAGELPVIFASQLAQLPTFDTLVERMLADARKCATGYNQAVRRWPAAGIAPLHVDREMIELPLWRLPPRWPRQRVFADVSDSQAILVGPDGVPLDRTHDRLAPRALMLTALMRSHLCDGFVHGLGGGEYDRVMESWWSSWIGEPLAPMAVVTADVFMTFDAPVNDRADLARAIWFARYLPHNLDRVLGLDGSLTMRKRQLIDTMYADNDRTRRSAAFGEIHRINRDMAAAQSQALDDAQRKLERTRTGLVNGRVAARRDWCFALYPPEQLHALAAAIREAATIAA